MIKGLLAKQLTAYPLYLSLSAPHLISSLCVSLLLSPPSLSMPNILYLVILSLSLSLPNIQSLCRPTQCHTVSIVYTLQSIPQSIDSNSLNQSCRDIFLGQVSGLTKGTEVLQSNYFQLNIENSKLHISSTSCLHLRHSDLNCGVCNQERWTKTG